MKQGKLYLVSVGPGVAALIPPLVQQAIEASDAIVSYELYLTWVQPWLDGKEIYSPPLTQERERASKAIELARAGKQVSLISSGDIGVYAMATLAFELMEDNEPFEVQVIPGITAANSCASLLGAPLSHDFATLSLSDLLCPWEWIEKRAQHIAQADLAVVFYNVQSKTRQNGVYRIIDIMLEHKSPDTWCGVVRNAYRDDQEISYLRLSDLRQRKFDMLTSIVIGNRFTQFRGGFLFTPRGYEGWGNTEEKAEALPQKAFWIFSGTSDGNDLVEKLQSTQKPLIVSTATDYGKSLISQKLPDVFVMSGSLGEATRLKLLKDSQAQGIVDATHPFASQISQQLIQLAETLEIPYLRFERPVPDSLGNSIICQTMEEASKKAIQMGKRIFLTTGSKDLSTFLQTSSSQEVDWFVRITPDSEMVQRAVDLGIPHNHICAMQGPFSQEFNELLWKQWAIDCVVTKEAGDSGGFTAKIQAAQTLDIPIIVVQRPSLSYPNIFHDADSIVDYINQRF